MFRLKTGNSSLALPVRNLWTVSASASIALCSYVLVGFSIHEVAGPSSVIGVAIAAAVALVAALAYVELTWRTQMTGSPYSFCYTYLGELPAFVVGWAVIGECALGAGLMGKTITYYINFLTEGQLVHALRRCCYVSDAYLWSFFDPVGLVCVLIVGVTCAISSRTACRINQVLLTVNFLTVIVTLVFIDIKGTKDSWTLKNGTSVFFSGGAVGVFKSSAIYSHVFLTLATTASLATKDRGPAAASALSLIVTTIVACIAITKCVLTSKLVPYDQLDVFTPVATFMRSDGDWEWVGVVNAVGALVSAAAGILSMLVLSSNTLEQMAADGLLWSRLSSAKPSISGSTATLVSTGLAIGCAMFQDQRGLVLCLSSGTFLVFQALLVAVMVARAHSSNESALLMVLKFTWLLYFFTSPAVVIVAHHFSDSKPAQSAVQGILAGCVLLFLQVVINRRQLNYKVVLVQVFTSLVIGFSSYIMYQLDDRAWIRFFIWTTIGIIIYSIYGYRKSKLVRGISDLVVVPSAECPHNLDHGLENGAFDEELSQLGWGDARSHRSARSFASARSNRRISFHSATRTSSFKSARENADARSGRVGSVSSWKSAIQGLELDCYSVISSESFEFRSFHDESSTFAAFEVQASKISPENRNTSSSFQELNHKTSSPFASLASAVSPDAEILVDPKVFCKEMYSNSNKNNDRDRIVWARSISLDGSFTDVRSELSDTKPGPGSFSDVIEPDLRSTSWNSLASVSDAESEFCSPEQVCEYFAKPNTSTVEYLPLTGAREVQGTQCSQLAIQGNVVKSDLDGNISCESSKMRSLISVNTKDGSRSDVSQRLLDATVHSPRSANNFKNFDGDCNSKKLPLQAINQAPRLFTKGSWCVLNNNVTSHEHMINSDDIFPERESKNLSPVVSVVSNGVDPSIVHKYLRYSKPIVDPEVPSLLSIKSCESFPESMQHDSEVFEDETESSGSVDSASDRSS